MGMWGYDWEPFEVVTSDGYTLTLMHVTKESGPMKKSVDKSLDPVMIVSPMGS